MLSPMYQLKNPHLWETLIGISQASEQTIPWQAEDLQPPPQMVSTPYCPPAKNENPHQLSYLLS